MAATVAGIIFSNLHDNNIPELTRVRTMASVPFGCRYRFIDFALSNMVNSGITNVNVITHNNYHSLMDHVGSGKDWDLARRSGGLKILPPFSTVSSKDSKLFTTRLEALCSISDVIDSMSEELVVMSDCDSICNINLQQMISEHISSGADMTFAVKKVNLTVEKAHCEAIVRTDENDCILEVVDQPENIKGEQDVMINISVVKKEVLSAMVHAARNKHYSSLYTDIINKAVNIKKFRVFRYDGFYADVTSMTDYYECNMSILEKRNRDALFGIKGRPILTKVRNSAPAKYIEGSKVVNSMIADGCIIEGTVENSMLFRGVKVGKGTVVKNCILFQDVYTGNDVFLNCVIADKNVKITDNVMLSGHRTVPFYIEKGRVIKDR